MVTLRQKRYWFTISCSIVLISVFSFATIEAFHYFSIENIRDQARMTAEMLRVSLTEQMRKGVISERQDLFLRLRKIPGLVDVRVIRGQPVIQQFGTGHNDEQVQSDIEKRVLKTGKAEEVLDETGENTSFTITIPYIASQYNDINCLACHHVAEGAINGVVTLSFSLKNMRQSALTAILPIIILLCLFGAALGYFLKRIIQPVVDTAEGMQNVVKRAQVGDFSGRIEVQSNDELGSMAKHANALMDTLESSIGSISSNMLSIGHGHNHDQHTDNLLLHTVNMVNEIVGASRFKQIIENDLDLQEIYPRIQRVLTEHFGLSRFTFYATHGSQGLKAVFISGLENDAELWCDPDILVHKDACRACRTATEATSLKHPNICNRFYGQEKGQGDLFHLCIPMILSGSVGGVLQVVLNQEEANQHRNLAQALSIYLEEAAPVIESRQLMQSLKESTLRDPMTGLYNRRFLEDYMETLNASIQRRKTSMGILMVDVDFFKQVNDTHGHDAGDNILKELARILKKAARTSDLVIRYGGEEFMLLLPDADQEGSLIIAERIRKNMEDAVFDLPTTKLKKTLSVGVSVYPEEGTGFWETVKHADIALYEAKSTGRNKVIFFDPSMRDHEEEY